LRIGERKRRGGDGWHHHILPCYLDDRPLAAFTAFDRFPVFARRPVTQVRIGRVRQPRQRLLYYGRRRRKPNAANGPQTGDMRRRRRTVAFSPARRAIGERPRRVYRPRATRNSHRPRLSLPRSVPPTARSLRERYLLVRPAGGPSLARCNAPRPWLPPATRLDHTGPRTCFTDTLVDRHARARRRWA
jgi:hypothetical protein